MQFKHEFRFHLDILKVQHQQQFQQQLHNKIALKPTIYTSHYPTSWQ